MTLPVSRSATATAAAVVLCAWTVSTAAQTGPVYSRFVDRVIERVVVPGHADFVAATQALVASASELCTDPSEAALESVRTDLAGVVTAFSRVEPFRFGPARKNNRYERLFFWPDRRGRGRRQVEKMIAREDPTTLEVAALRKKSVAVQGLLALDYVFGGDAGRALAEGSAAFRCRQGGAIAMAVNLTARRIHEEWTGADGFGALMRAAGPDNPVYRSHGETVQDLLGAVGEQLSVVEGMKLRRMLGTGPERAKPKLAPFWRSRLAISTVVSNLDGVLSVLDTGGLETLLPVSDSGLAERLVAELREVRGELSGVSEADLADLLADPAEHRRLAGAADRIAFASSLLGGQIMSTLGIAPGFNSLDGD